MSEDRFKKTEFAAWIKMIGNVVLAAVKGFIGYVANSKALITDANHILIESIHNSLDHVIHEEEAQGLVEAVEKVEGVMKVDKLFAREHGHYVIVDVKIGVNPHITVEKGHAIGKEVKYKLMNEFDHVQDVMVHINPYHTDFPDPGSELSH